MIIVSQDREIVIEDFNLGIKERGEYLIYDIKMVADLGYYKTKERAKEILQNIIIAKNSDSKIFEMPEE